MARTKNVDRPVAGLPAGQANNIALPPGQRGMVLRATPFKSSGENPRNQHGEWVAASPSRAVATAVKSWAASPPMHGVIVRAGGSGGGGGAGAGSPDAAGPAALPSHQSCTACAAVTPSLQLEPHPVLDAVLCQSCSDYYVSDTLPENWVKLRGKHRYCRWCGTNDLCHSDGDGLVVECPDATCPAIFCKACIARNFSEEEYDRVQADPQWRCYQCDPSALRKLPGYAALRSAVQARNKESRRKSAGGQHTKTPVGKFDDARRNHMVSVLSEWTAQNPGYDGYLPSKEEKLELALTCSVPVKKIEYWFWARNKVLRRDGVRIGDAPAELAGTGKRKLPPSPPALLSRKCFKAGNPIIRSTTKPGKATNRCTACGINDSVVGLHDHKSLQAVAVAVCVTCKDSSNSAGKHDCLWCGSSVAEAHGTIRCGKGCAGTYCKACIVRNFSIQQWKRVKKAPGRWSCFGCAPAPLHSTPRMGLKIRFEVGLGQMTDGVISSMDAPEPGQFYVQRADRHTRTLIDPSANAMFEAAGLPGRKTSQPVAATGASASSKPLSKSGAKPSGAQRSATTGGGQRPAATAGPAATGLEGGAKIWFTFGKDKHGIAVSDIQKVLMGRSDGAEGLEKLLRRELQLVPGQRYAISSDSSGNSARSPPSQSQRGSSTGRFAGLQSVTAKPRPGTTFHVQKVRR